MNIQEREKLIRFLQQLAQAQPGAKDHEADLLIQDACRSQPDAHYLLVQRNLLLEQALENVQAENVRLRSECEHLERSAGASGAGGGFLDGNAWGARPAPAAAPARAPAYAPAAPVAPATYAAPASSSFLNSGILGSVATTAAGVVAGSFLFQGIEHLMGNHGGGSGFLSGNNSPGANPVSEDVVVNNYYDTPASNLDDVDVAADDGGLDWV
jgi:hypothetical protein